MTSDDASRGSPEEPIEEPIEEEIEEEMGAAVSLFRRIKDRVADEVDAWRAAGEPPQRTVSAQAAPNEHTCNVCQARECVGKNRQCNDCIATFMGGA